MKERLASIGGIVSAFLASICCVGPVVLSVLGVAGTGFLLRFEWLRPYFLVISFVFLGIAYRYSYGRASRCNSERKCDMRSKRTNRFLFWVLAGFVLFGVVSPYLL
ncbi:MAG: mercury transporter MerT [Deltaproteobacteria bacterium]|nr:mercury transporter MerT [Deltaproteobacteria bacterium]